MKPSARLLALPLLIFGLLLLGCDSNGSNNEEEGKPAKLSFVNTAESYTITETDPGTPQAETFTVEVSGLGDENITAEVVFDAEESSASSDDLGGFSSREVLFPGANPSDKVERDVVVSITADEEPEDTEKAIFNIENIEGNAEIESLGTVELLIEDDD